MLRVQLPTRGTLLCLLFLNDTTFETANRSESSPWMSKARSQLNLSSTGGNHTKKCVHPGCLSQCHRALGSQWVSWSSESWAAPAYTDTFLPLLPAQRLRLTNRAPVGSWGCMSRKLGVCPSSANAAHSSPSAPCLDPLLHSQLPVMIQASQVQTPVCNFWSNYGSSFRFSPK